MEVKEILVKGIFGDFPVFREFPFGTLRQIIHVQNNKENSFVNFLMSESDDLAGCCSFDHWNGTFTMQSIQSGSKK